jgi:predicted acetyltransferase
MATATIELVETQPAEKQELWPMLQEYLRELDRLHGMEHLPGKVFDYPDWDAYWDGSPDRHIFWIVIGGGKVGFVLFRGLPAAEWPGLPLPTQIAEFCVLRPFRSREIGSSVMKFLFEDFRQRGEILTWDCLGLNDRAEKMYDRVVAEYKAAAGADWNCEKTEFVSDAGRTYRYVCVPD